MKKSELKPGYIIEYRNKGTRLIVENPIYKDWYLLGLANHSKFEDMLFNEDLTMSLSQEYDIMAVYIPRRSVGLNFLLNEKQYLDCVWERPKEVELTMQDIAEAFNIPVEQLKVVK